VQRNSLFDEWIRSSPQGASAGTRLICFPHAAGAASFYRPWAPGLGPGIEQLIVQYPGREDRIRESCIVDMAEMADRVAEAITPALDQPVALFGHSMGAAIAYEVTQRIEDQRPGSITSLLVSACRVAGQRRRMSAHLLDDDALAVHLRSLGGMKEIVFRYPELLSIVLRAARADYRLIETYAPSRVRCLKVPIFALGGDSDTHAAPGDLARWAELTSGGFQQRTFSGGHFYLVNRRCEVVDAIRSHLSAHEMRLKEFRCAHGGHSFPGSPGSDYMPRPDRCVVGD